mmetsp:Transcript_92850/g.165100  ORF Transcript_92850/g.165100 Transcript_92850/m.165100 type:complete len:253 (+) Transcript_92850:57-815(+)|eukprot:CAMPEP_0197660062 /NCGR_PEP_ID=MMETSP1338-20131121/50268_1 /TAXON_ID=43686 ORGANISM="Pelagodinium beii, Strain RCC1491" /NCGR_SAMPLE_ID=MMETSP1338 /ASSEMBLY_ACC=CAM_ASM_000754 /LENGTH=252 /DNA_ID=CAMNT_0043237305 /DNA_START=42 /DNA_END=800 /DNA_ORIENTATION=+
MNRLLILLAAFSSCDGVVHRSSHMSVPTPGKGYIDIRGVPFDHGWYQAEQPKLRCKGSAMLEKPGGLKASNYDEWLCSTKNGTTGSEDHCNHRWETSRDGRVHRQCKASPASPGYFNCLATTPCFVNDCTIYAGMKTQEEVGACGVYNLRTCEDGNKENGGNCHCGSGSEHHGAGFTEEMKTGFARALAECDVKVDCLGFEVLVRGVTNNDYGHFRLLKKCSKVEPFGDGAKAENTPNKFGEGTGTRVYQKP